MLRTLIGRFRALVWLALLTGLLTIPPLAYAQRGRGDSETSLKSNKNFLAVFRDVVAKASHSTVRIRCDDEVAAFGVIVGADGWILTKATEMKGTIACELQDGREFPAHIVGISDAYDLAMLKIEAKGLTPVVWRDSTDDAVGSWVAASGLNRDPVAVGVVSVGAREIKGPELSRRSRSGGFLGIRVASARNGVRVAEVIRGGAAAKAGFEEDDVIIAVESTTITDPESLFKALQKTKPDKRITVRVRRGSEEVVLKPILGDQPLERADFQNQLGGKLSDRRTGFPKVLQHDAVLRPVDCGGPLVDLDGKVIGINIARAGRTETLAIPAEAVKPLLDDLKSGKLAPKK